MLTTVRTAVTRFMREEDGASLVEYVLLIALIAVVCIGAITALSTHIQTGLTNASNAIAPQ